MSDGGAPKRGKARPETRQVLLVVATVLLAWFAFANLESVSIHFWLSTAKAPLIAVIGISAALGAAVGVARGGRRRRKPTPRDQ